VIVFHELSKDEVTVIIDLMMERVRGQLEGQGINIELTRAAKYLVVEKGYDPTMGARPLRRALQRRVEDPLSERILSKEFRAGDTIIVDAENGEVAFRVMEHFEPPPVELAGAGASD
jgi:ATP-dependent Clp protease ATP-binding subunit ClpC